MISLSLGQKGVAVTTVVVAAVAIAGASAGTPVAVDEIDTQPDSPLYGLEKAGETIKEFIYAGGQQWNIDRAEERTSEFISMAKKGKDSEFRKLLSNAEDRLSKAAKGADDVKGLEVAENAICKHIEVLENVKGKVPSEAKVAISLAISRSAKGKAVVSGVKVENFPEEGLPKAVKEKMEEKLEKIEQVTSSLRENVEGKLEEGALPAPELVENIELETFEDLSEKVKELASKNKGAAIPDIVEEAQDRIDAASDAEVDNEGLERAIEANLKHLGVLDNVYPKVPGPAKPAISLAKVRSSRHIQILENIKENELPPGGEVPEAVREELEDKLGELNENIEQRLEQVEERIKKATGRPSEIEEIAEGYENHAREEREKAKEKFMEWTENITIENILKDPEIFFYSDTQVTVEGEILVEDGIDYMYDGTGKLPIYMEEPPSDYGAGAEVRAKGEIEFKVIKGTGLYALEVEQITVTKSATGEEGGLDTTPPVFSNLKVNGKTGTEVTTQLEGAFIEGKIVDDVSSPADLELSATKDGKEVEGVPIIHENGEFDLSVSPLDLGLNIIEITATDNAGNSASKTLKVTYATVPEEAPRVVELYVDGKAENEVTVTENHVTVSGKVADNDTPISELSFGAYHEEPIGHIELENIPIDSSGSFQFERALSYFPIKKPGVTWKITVCVWDPDGNYTMTSRLVTLKE